MLHNVRKRLMWAFIHCSLTRLSLFGCLQLLSSWQLSIWNFWPWLWPSESCVLSSVPLLLSPMSFHSVQPWLLQTDQICILFFLVPCHIHLIRLLWVPSTASHINERGDFFESSSLSRPVLHFFLVFPFAQVPVSSSFYSWSTPSHHCSRQMTYLKFRWIWVNAFPVSVRWLWPVFSAGFLP